MHFMAKHPKVELGDAEVGTYCLKTRFMWMLEQTQSERCVEEDVQVMVAELFKHLQRPIS